MVKMHPNQLHIFLRGIILFCFVLSEGDSSTCGSYCLNSTETPAGPACKESSGKCLYGCVSGYAGAQCLIPCGENCVNCSISDGTDNDIECHQCENGHYGVQCDKQCYSNCLVNATSDLTTCDRLDGTCTLGCKDKTYYGPRCDRQCSNKCQQSLCERDGVCSVGCTFPMLGGPKCDRQCSVGCVGPDIECDQQFKCVLGCKPNYWGPTCQPCSEECTNSTSPGTVVGCLKSDGFCQFGCTVGKYGHTCSETCPRHCKDVICSQTSGECHTCTKGYFGNYCNNTCSSNCPGNDCYPSNGSCVADDCLVTQYAWYGPSCDLRCPGNCKNKVCDKYNGYCLDGCISGYFGNSCNSDITTTLSTTDYTPLCGITQTFSQNNTPVAVVGGVLGVALLAALVVIVVLLRSGSNGAASATNIKTADLELQNTGDNYEILNHRNETSPTYDELTSNDDMHESSEEFEFLPDPTTGCGVSCLILTGIAVTEDKNTSRATPTDKDVYENTRETDIQ